MALIYLYESTETDFRYNGKPLPKAVVDVQWGLNDEFYAMGRYPIDEDEVYKEIVEDRIVKVHTFHGMEPMRIVDVQDRDLYVEFEAWPLFFADMRNKMVKPLNLRNATGQVALNALFNNLLIEPRFNFYSNITETHDYHTQDFEERENNPNQLYDALEVFSAIVRRWNGEISIRGYDIRMNNRVGTDTEALLYEKKNITEFLDGTNIKNIVTRAHGKAEWTEEGPDGEQIDRSIQATVDSPLINAYSGIIFERQYTNNDVRSEKELKDWLSLKFSTENLDKPTRSIEVNTNMINGTNVGPADTLILKYIKHDVDMRIKIVGYEYDGFANKLKRFILGEPKATVANTIGNTITETISNVVRPIAQTAIRAQQSADGKRTKYSGTQDPNTLSLNANKGDEYWRDIGDETIIYEFNGTTWDIIIDTSETTKNADAIAEQQQDIEEAKQTADEAVNRINNEIAGKFTSIDDDILAIETISNSAQANAQTALNQSQDALGDASVALTNAQTALNRADSLSGDVSTINVEIDDINSSLSLKADSSLVDTISQTVNNHSLAIDANAQGLALKASQSSVDTLTGRVNTAETSITANATAIGLKANQTTVDTLTGTVNTLSGRVDVTAGQISSKVWNADIVAAIDDTISLINHVESELTQKHDSITTAVSSIDGRVATNQLNLDGAITRVGNAEGRLTTVETNISGLQTTVVSKASQSEVTQLATGLSSVVEQSVKSFEVYARNYNGGPRGHIKGPDNNTLIGRGVSSDRSYMMVVIDQNDVIVHSDVYDIYRHQSEADRFISRVENYDESFLFIIVGSHAAERNRLSIKDTIYDLGGSPEVFEEMMSVRSSYVLVGKRGLGTRNGYENHARTNGGYLKMIVPVKNGASSLLGDFNIVSSQISQLRDNINLRVAKGDVVSQLNIDAGRTLISSSKILLNANTVSISGTAWMDGAVMKNASVGTAQIADLAVTSGKIASMDAGKISTGTLEGIAINGVTITGSTYIQENPTAGSTHGRWDRRGITLRDASGAMIMDMNIEGLNFHGSGVSHRGTYINNDLIDVQNATIYNLNVTGPRAYMNAATFSGNVSVGSAQRSIDAGIIFNGQSTPTPYNRMIWAGFGSSGNGLYTYFNGWKRVQDEITNVSNITVNSLTTNSLTIGSPLTLTNRLSLQNAGLQFIGGSLPGPVDRQMWIGYGYDNNGIYVSLGGNWYKHGATISDERLKKNIVETAMDSLDAIDSWKFVEFEWKDSVFGSGQQFGLIAQNTSHIANYYDEVDRWEIDTQKLSMMTAHGLQQLSLREENTNQVASQALQLGESNEEKIKRLEKRIEELESAA